MKRRLITVSVTLMALVAGLAPIAEAAGRWG
jgi:hypothetical protein